MFNHKRILFSLLLAIVSLGIMGQSAAAHTQQKVGTLKITLHIEPNDKPVTGVGQTIDFIFDDTSKNFDDSNCDCVMTVTKNAKTLFVTTVPSVSAYLGKVSYTFQDSGNYHLILNGKPRVGDTFKPFKVTFDDVNVEDGQSQGTKILLGLAIAMALAVPALFVLSYVLSR